jgi:hypothetical protein
MCEPARILDPWQTAPKHAGSDTQVCIARLNMDRAGNRAPAGKAQWRGFEPPRAEPDGFLVHYPDHSVTMLYIAARTQLPKANITGTHHRQAS